MKCIHVHNEDKITTVQEERLPCRLPALDHSGLIAKATTGPGTVTITAALPEPARTRTAPGRPAPCHGQLTVHRATTSLPTVDCHCIVAGSTTHSSTYKSDTL
ncbi:hypothetical protein J6590_080066 [Homalodisca vitripennis]|nr:hypothetical protein J6590_080066 [Homalodisca vitripennis]